MLYFDNNASTPLLPEVKLALRQAMDNYMGNPSSGHLYGSQLRQALGLAKRHLAGLVGVDPDRVVCLSGATEANNLALRSVASEKAGARFVSTRAEHPSVYNPLIQLVNEGHTVRWLEIDSSGLIDLNHFEDELRDKPDLVSIQWVNSETGVIQPIPEIAEMCKTYGVRLHVDGAQAVGRLNINLQTIPIHFLSLSGHKLHAPSGVGALIYAEGAELHPMILGGDQESRKRAGTENWLGILGLGEAAKLRHDRLVQHSETMRDLRDTFEHALLLRIPNTKVVAQQSPRVVNSSNIFFKGIDGIALTAQLNDRGLMCSQSSACSNHRPEPSRTLRAMGLSESDAYSCIRFSFSIMNTLQEIRQGIEMIEEASSRLLTFSRGIL